ncbi:MAG TPA: TolC family protein [Gemmatimonadales bacterium]|nr:TolC family protein [Gemmatimonadales bacterium]
MRPAVPLLRRSGPARALPALAAAAAAVLLAPPRPALAQQRDSAGAAAAAAAVPARPLTLLDAVGLGRRRGVSVALAQLSARVAERRVGERRGELLPQVSGAAEYTRQTVNFSEFGLSLPGVPAVSPGFNLWRAQLRGSQTILDLATLARVSAARDTARAAGLDVQAVGEAAGAQAGLAYLRAVSAEETVRARQADSAVAAQLLEQARQLVASGVSPVIDQTRSEVSFQAVRTQLELARNARDRAQLDLRRALDLPPDAPIALADSLAPLETELPTEPGAAVAYARTHRAELRAEQARTAAARRNLRAIKLEYLPSLNANGYYQQSGTALSALNGTYQVNVLLSLPIFDGLRRESRTAEQRFRLEAQELRERDLGNQVATEASQAVLDLASARQQMLLAGTRLQLAEQELAQAQERFQAGVAGSVETTQAQSSLIAARDALIQARVGFATAHLNTYRALGVIDQLH